MSTLNLYETDFYAWTQRQVELLGSQQWHHLDLPNLIEEIASLGKTPREREGFGDGRNRFTSTFPAACLYGLAEVLDERFYPGEPSNLIGDAEF